MILSQLEQIKSIAYTFPKTSKEKILIMDVCDYLLLINYSLKNITFYEYLPHWIKSQYYRDDLYSKLNMRKLILECTNPINNGVIYGKNAINNSGN